MTYFDPFWDPVRTPVSTPSERVLPDGQKRGSRADAQYHSLQAVSHVGVETPALQYPHLVTTGEFMTVLPQKLTR